MINSNHMWLSEGSRFMGNMHGRGMMDFHDFGPSPLISISIVTGLLLLAAIWTIAIKGYALWTAAQRREKWWFIALLIVNSFGLLEIAYLLFFAKKVDWKNRDADANNLSSKTEHSQQATSAHDHSHVHENKEKQDDKPAAN